MSIKNMTLRCDVCGEGFKPYRERKDGLPSGVRFECHDRSYIAICSDCVMSDHYEVVINIMKGRMKNE